MSEMVVRCAWCGRFRTGEDWAAQTEPPDPRWTSHGVCPDCFDDLLVTLQPHVRDGALETDGPGVSS
jgi:hypothetical protein